MSVDATKGRGVGEMSESITEIKTSSAKRILPVAPLSFFAMTLGLAETGSAWRSASAAFDAPSLPGEVLEALAVLTFLWWMSLYVNKWVNHRATAQAELADPEQASFVALIPESLILVALAVHPYQSGIAVTVFWIGSVLNIFYAAYRLSRLWTIDRKDEHTTPSLFLVYVASVLVNSLAAAHFGYTAFGWSLFGIGAISWLILDSVISGRLFVGGLETRMRNFMGIYMAPSAVAVVAYQMLSGEAANSAITYALMGYALFIAVTLLLSWTWLREQAFAPGYWAYTFGVSTLSQGLTALYAKEKTEFLFMTSFGLLAASSLLLLVVCAASTSLQTSRDWKRERSNSDEGRRRKVVAQ